MMLSCASRHYASEVHGAPCTREILAGRGFGSGPDHQVLEQQLQPGAATALPQSLQGKLLKASVHSYQHFATAMKQDSVHYTEQCKLELPVSLWPCECCIRRI
jgi:hypothetical protein